MLIKKLLSNITGENFRRGKVTKYFPSDEYFSPTKIFPDKVAQNAWEAAADELDFVENGKNDFCYFQCFY